MVHGKSHFKVTETEVEWGLRREEERKIQSLESKEVRERAKFLQEQY